MYTNNRARFCTLQSKREKQPTSRPNFPPFYLGLAQEGPALPLGNAAYNQTHGVGTDGERRSQFASLLFLPMNVVMKDLAKRRILQSFQFNLLK